MIYSKGEPLKKVPTESLVDELFAEIDKYYEAGKVVVRDAARAAEAAAWLAENEDEFAITPERLAAAEKAKAAEEAEQTSAMLKVDESESPVAGRRFKRDAA